MPSSLKNLRLNIFLLQSAVFVLISVLIYSNTRNGQLKLAEAVVATVRDDLLVGDTRSVIRNLSPIVEHGAFSAVQFRAAPTGVVIFDLKTESRATFGHLLTINQIVPVIFSAKSDKQFGSFTFVSDITVCFVVILALLAFLCILSTAFFRVAKRHVALEDKSRHEEHRAKAIADTVSLLVHDLKRPFFHINMALESLKKAPNFDAVKILLDSLIPKTRQSMQAANALLDELRECDHGTLENPKVFDLAAMVQEAVTDAREQSLATNLTIDLSTSDGCWIRGDRKKMRRAFDNLLINAIQANDGKGAISIEVENSDHVALNIWNSESQLSESERSLIFAPFSTSGRQFGSGLGLGFVSGIIKTHNGTIQCTNAAKGGLTMSLRLPKCHDGGLLPCTKNFQMALFAH